MRMSTESGKKLVDDEPLGLPSTKEADPWAKHHQLRGLELAEAIGERIDKVRKELERLFAFWGLTAGCRSYFSPSHWHSRRAITINVIGGRRSRTLRAFRGSFPQKKIPHWRKTWCGARAIWSDRAANGTLRRFPGTDAMPIGQTRIIDDSRGGRAQARGTNGVRGFTGNLEVLAGHSGHLRPSILRQDGT